MNTEGLYDSSFEHDACGIGFVAHMKGRKSHQIIEDAIRMLTRMEHRGACGCEVNTGDGAGILIQMPHEFFLDECTKLGMILPPYGEYGVGMVFFPKDAELREECRTILDRKIKQLGLELIGYRQVPTNNDGIGASALSAEPVMEQVFIKLIEPVAEPVEFERKLFVLRNYATRVINESVQGVDGSFYFASLSYKTIIYKGQFTTEQVRPYFSDLHHENVVSALAVIHSRFSTNTFPSWKLAQPFRYIAHNGEINTVRGNVNWFQASETEFESEYFTKEELDMLRPICGASQSDSANLDNVIEMLVLSGRSLPHVMMMLIPEAWDGNEQMEKMRKEFYEYHASLMAPWDGPASITFTDGKIIGATLDRNGLRPSRYCVTDDDRVIMASEAGVLDLDESIIVSKGRLQPGRMLIVDMEQGKILSDEEVKAKICTQQPYGSWLAENKIKLKEILKPASRFVPLSNKNLIKRQIEAGYTSEDLKYIVGAMATSAKGSLGSMGLDTPLAILSEQSQHLSNYFKQLFAQVTNPPIDSIRERSVMSLISFVGAKQNLLSETPKHCHTLELTQPILSNRSLEKIRHLDHKGFQTKTIFTYFKADAQAGRLERGLERICNYAEDAVEDGFSIIILSDRTSDSNHAQIPSLLAMSAVHHHLINKGLRDNIGLISETADAWESHHFATLIGFGASGVNPYLALETIDYLKRKERLNTEFTNEELQKNYIKAIGKELLKIFAKMGISTLQSYQGAQIFEALGIDKEVIDKYFTSTVSRIGGLKLDDIAREVIVRHQIVYPTKNEITKNKLRLEEGGIYQWKQRGEEHIFNPQTIHLLQQSTQKKDYQLFKKYTRLIDDQTQKALTLRGMLKFKSSNPIPIEEVEPAESIFKRFATGAMSFGSISWEAHTTLAIAMNRIGGKSNSGEGGEDIKRYQKLENGDSMNSSIKQVASGRFGVNSYYLSNATEIQIKMAQGAKPGEGGQLPGHKVDDWIAKVRYSTPGVGLISPPPHHDIYSIEDLAQLIFDLKNANRHARINVKLVSEAGVGTIAAGVAKAHADVVLIAGHDGGTGASPLSSIRHAGLPWELGVAETHQTLVKNKLRSRITVQADGQIRTGKDLAVAALLGAEEWGVATAALVSTGCIMMRKCHMNTCPVGIATQRKELRTLFTGKPEYVVNLFKFLAEELREIMAELGFRTVNEMIGQSDKLAVRDDITHWKHQNLDLSRILYRTDASSEVGLFKQEEQDHGIDNILDWKILKQAKPAIENLEPIKAEFKIQNTDRAVGALLSHEISKKYGLKGLPKDTLHLKFKGTAGQSFAAFAVRGVTMEIEGAANDYVGKGLSGAKLIFYPDHTSKFVPAQNSIIGNVAFYGATSGEAYIRGMAGERFAVRNSGVKTVVEGIGDHGCEYMTGGLVINLGDTGRNFAAGMSGGVAYIWNKKNDFEQKLNAEMATVEQLNIEDKKILNIYIENHLQHTGSLLAKEILDNWETMTSHFIKIMPTDFRNALSERNITLFQKLDDELVVSE
ncbi:glutamate synthase family protein [Bernardetia litoralis DSM 6794]|uniref:Glutamate synthase [NADPH] large chain n=1 Tax=Bernardetia litoralis (strain ATCC 23117 / DSM 6794 / NBRC 15988 / NCIMB 1366 / Fx l1 / Sio-4) TaxID=880071 RepID=I4AJX2_BERLS|nr:glutamate synthase large subunit [Bernardetia litoralis]AFM04257.1 glutamate synthase family protein [Bernardetia litoralis DSM 6794]